MFNQTRQNLSSFDNEHEFERLAADLLNSLGFVNVEPMAPLGGADGGIDIKYTNGQSTGIAFVTLRKDISKKFKEDLGKLENSPNEISLFCIIDITPKMKIKFAKEANSKGAILEIYDLERIRSLFDSTLKILRRRYLGIDDDISKQIKDRILKLIRFRNASIIEYKEKTILEGMFVNKLPLELFYLLLSFDLNDVKEVPDIGKELNEYLLKYDLFLGEIIKNEKDIIEHIGTWGGEIRGAWVINYRYSVMRFSGIDSANIKKQGFPLNYGLSWESVETIFSRLVDDNCLDNLLKPIFDEYEKLAQTCLKFNK